MGPHGNDGTRRPRRRGAVVVGALLIVVVVAAAAVTLGRLTAAALGATSAAPPAVGTAILASATSKAAHAATADGPDASAAAWLATQPTTVWLTPETDPIRAIPQRIAGLAQEARDQDATLSIAVYGLPDRDCGNHSAGGLDPAAYGDWTARIGEALDAASALRKIIVLEPDSIALASSCGSIAERTEYLRTAVDNLTGPDTWIYLDGGHSAWHSADDMAALLRETGLLPAVRGVALNVSNYQDTAAEFAYAHALSDRLGGTHAIIDTSRNGSGPAGARWCNPSGRTVGSPGGSYGDGVVDTNLWIKPPGESDGTCNGGPVAGTWWARAAIELTRSAL